MLDFGLWCGRIRRLREDLLSDYAGHEETARSHFLQSLIRAALNRYRAEVDIPQLLTAIEGATAWCSQDREVAFSEAEVRAIAESPTLIGWSYQIWNEVSRDASTWAISHKEDSQADRLSIAAATQIFTEEYMADFLAERCHTLLKDRASSYSMIDPACGAGNILARMFRLLVRETDASEVHSVVDAVVGRLHGCDIDAEVVRISRAVILLESMRLAPSAASRIVDSLNRNLFVLDSAEGVLNRKGNAPGLARTYDCVVANPPYLGRRKLTQQMRAFLDAEYPDSSLDLCAAVTRRCVELTAPGGAIGLVTSDRWLRLKGYHLFRQTFYRDLAVDVIAELGDRAFRSQLDLHDGVRVVLTVGRRGEVSREHEVQYLTVTSQRDSESKAQYLASQRCRDDDSATFLPQESLRDDTDGSIFLQVAGVPQALQKAASRLLMHAQVVVGLQTNDDGAFVRYHWQVAPDPTRWCPHNKGGGYDRWFGLNRWVLDKRPESMALYSRGSSGGFSLDQWFSRSGWTYSWFANGCLGVRRKEAGWSFGRAASSGLFCDDVRVVAYCNSRLASLCARLIGGKIQLPEGIVRRIPVPDDLSAIEPGLVEVAVRIKKRLVSGDPTELTFAPMDHPSVYERFILEVLLLLVEGELEKQVMQSAQMSTSEREQVASTIEEPVALRFGTPSLHALDRICHLVPNEWQPLYASLRLRSGGTSQQCSVSAHCRLTGVEQDSIERILRGVRPGPRKRSSFPAVGPVEQLCVALGVHPVEALARIDHYLNEEMQGVPSLCVEEQKLTLLVGVLRQLGFCWHSEGSKVVEPRQLTAEELAEGLSRSLDCEKAAEVIRCSVLRWIHDELEPWHRKLLLDAPIVQRSVSDGRFCAQLAR